MFEDITRSLIKVQKANKTRPLRWSLLLVSVYKPLTIQENYQLSLFFFSKNLHIIGVQFRAFFSHRFTHHWSIVDGQLSITLAEYRNSLCSLHAIYCESSSSKAYTINIRSLDCQGSPQTPQVHRLGFIWSIGFVGGLAP